MKLLNIQKKFVMCKPVENLIIRGKSNRGKSEALLHRVLYLQNNFAYELEDKLLFVVKDKNKKDEFVNRYENIKEKEKYTYVSLLSSEVKPEFKSFNEFFSIYLKDRKKASVKEKVEILKKIMYKEKNFKCKKFKEDNAYIILNEIKYIKNHSIFNIDDYMTLVGTPLKLRKNSFSRVEMFRLFEAYNNELSIRSLVDEEDLIHEAINNLKNGDNKYVHVLIDNAQEYSKLELEYLMMLAKKKSYGTLTLSIDLDKGENIYSSLVKKGRVYFSKVLKSNKRVFNFNTDLERKSNVKLDNLIKVKDIEKYVFRDLKYSREHSFSLQTSGEEGNLFSDNDEIFKSSELEDIPVFNNIAAGDPILINPEQEDTFKLPKYWIKGKSNKFILKVKGDSMIDANIKNGDLVVIEQNPSPLNGDIVAVNLDGNATLKRLKIEEDNILLMPENKNYKPIKVSKYDDFFVLGKAIGIITKGGI